MAPDQVYHVSVMPCYDKKLEASRPDFFDQEHQTRDVDCVLTTGAAQGSFPGQGRLHLFCFHGFVFPTLPVAFLHGSASVHPLFLKSILAYFCYYRFIVLCLFESQSDTEFHCPQQPGPGPPKSCQQLTYHWAWAHTIPLHGSDRCCVPGEVLRLLEEEGVSLSELEPAPLDSL